MEARDRIIQIARYHKGIQKQDVCWVTIKTIYAWLVLRFFRHGAVGLVDTSLKARFLNAGRCKPDGRNLQDDKRGERWQGAIFSFFFLVEQKTASNFGYIDRVWRRRGQLLIACP